MIYSNILYIDTINIYIELPLPMVNISTSTNVAQLLDGGKFGGYVQAWSTLVSIYVLTSDKRVERLTPVNILEMLK